MICDMIYIRLSGEDKTIEKMSFLVPSSLFPLHSPFGLTTSYYNPLSNPNNPNNPNNDYNLSLLKSYYGINMDIIRSSSNPNEGSENRDMLSLSSKSEGSENNPDNNHVLITDINPLNNPDSPDSPDNSISLTTTQDEYDRNNPSRNIITKPIKKRKLSSTTDYNERDAVSADTDVNSSYKPYNGVNSSSDSPPVPPVSSENGYNGGGGCNSVVPVLESRWMKVHKMWSLSENRTCVCVPVTTLFPHLPVSRYLSLYLSHTHTLSLSKKELFKHLNKHKYMSK